MQIALRHFQFAHECHGLAVKLHINVVIVDRKSVNIDDDIIARVLRTETHT